MQTTLDIDDDLLMAAKEIAKRMPTTSASVVGADDRHLCAIHDG